MSSEPTAFIRPDHFWRELGLRAGQTIVHLGCGPGFYVIPAAKIVGPSGTVIGIDILANLLAETESRSKREHVDQIVHTLRSNLEAPNGSTLPPAHADWVLMANIMHQAEPTAILTEAHRIVKREGHAVIVEWDTAASPMGPPSAARRSKGDIEQLAQAAGFTISRRFEPGAFHYGLLLTPAAS